MKKGIAISILFFYFLGNVLLPNFDLTRVHEQYSHCQVEDPDITLADFVFEHLLNIPDLLGVKEDAENSGKEKPHVPFHVTAISQNSALVSEPFLLRTSKPVILVPKSTQTGYFSLILPNGYWSNIFRPPIC